MDRIGTPSQCPSEMITCEFCGLPSHDRYCCSGCETAHLIQSARDPVSRSRALRKLVVSAFISMNLMTLNLGFNDDPKSPGVVGLMSMLLSFLVFGLLGPTLLRSTVRSLKERRVTIEFLFLIGVLAAQILSVRDVLSQVGPIYFDTTGILLVVYTLGKWVSAQSRFKAVEESRALLEGEVQTQSRLLRTGEVENVPLNGLLPGDRIQVFENQVLAADGLILSGSGLVRETLFSGEPLPAYRKTGDQIFAGSRLIDGTLVVEIQRLGPSTRLQGILDSVESALHNRCRALMIADQLTARFIPAVLVATAVVFAFWLKVDGPESALLNSLSVLLIACPCAFGLATPLALWSGISSLASLGFYVRDADAMERLGEIDTIVFDKTGTLTDARCSPEAWVFDDSLSARERELLRRVIAAVESHSAHPYAKLLRSRHRPSKQVRVSSVSSLPGIGLRAQAEADGQIFEIAVGNDKLLVQPSEVSVALKFRKRLTGTDGVIKELYVQLSGGIAALIPIQETLREDLNALQSSLVGVSRIEIMTGDPNPASDALFEKYGISVQHGLSPEDKASAVRELQSKGSRVLFIGDGVNDTPAMAESHVSIALRSEIDSPLRVSSIGFAGSNLQQIASAIELSTRVRSRIKSNLRWMLIYNLFAMGIAGCGMLNPVFAAISMSLSSIFVSWRSLNVHDAKKPETKTNLATSRANSSI